MLRVVLKEARYALPRLEKVLVDGGCRGPDPEAVRREYGATAEVVLRSDGAKGFEVIPKRWVVERTFGWLNRQRRLSKAYDRNPESTRAWIHVAAARLTAARLAA